MHDRCMSYDEPVPADLNTKDPFFSKGPVKLSIQEIVTVLGSGVFWLVIAKAFLAGIFGLNMILALVASGIIPIAGFVFAFKKVGRKNFDVWVGEKLAFEFGPQTFVGRAEDDFGSYEADLTRDADIEEFITDRR